MDDFLGIRGTDSGAEDGSGGRVDSVGSGVQWPLCNKASSAKQFMPFKTQLEEKSQKVLFDPISSAAFQPITIAGTKTKTCTAHDPQASFGIDSNNVQQVFVHAYQNQDVNNCLSSTHLEPVSHASSPINMNNLFFNVHGPSNGSNLTVTAIKPQPFRLLVTNNNSPRKVVKPPTTGQLTIFYAGSVNVYDDVSWDKAQAVMLKASEGCKASADAVHSIADAPPLPLTKASMSNHLTFAHASNSVKNHVMSSCPVLPSALSLSTLKRNQPGSGSTDTDDQAGAKRIGAMVSTFEDEQSRAMSTSMVATTAAKIFPRAVPQARKASLARFLEKRKERVSNAMPYSFDKNSSENSAVPDVTAASSNCSVPQNYRTNNQNFSLVKGQAKNCDDSSDSPSTNLEM